MQKGRIVTRLYRLGFYTPERGRVRDFNEPARPGVWFTPEQWEALKDSIAEMDRIHGSSPEKEGFIVDEVEVNHWDSGE